ncbi:MAG: HTH domain-containing protein [archaeon]|nr:HTH domain-containing protein [archaeon]
MIDFACKKVSHEDLVRCSYNLNKTEYNVLLEMLKGGGGNASELAKKMGLERTTVHKALTALAEKSLAKKTQINLEHGGYAFTYAPKDRQKIRQELSAIINDWHQKALREANFF